MVLALVGHQAEIVTRPEMPTGPLNRVADNALARKAPGLGAERHVSGRAAAHGRLVPQREEPGEMRGGCCVSERYSRARWPSRNDPPLDQTGRSPRADLRKHGRVAGVELRPRRCSARCAHDLESS